MTRADAMREACEARAVPMVVVGGRDFVDVEIGGGKSLRLQVDTGGNAFGVVVFRSARERLSLPTVATLPRRLRIGGRVVELPPDATWVELDDVSPEARRSPVDPRRVRKEESDGQIGAGFLSHFLVCLDASRGRLGLVPRDVLRVRDEGGVPLRLFADERTTALYPFVETELGALLVDSGPPVGFLEERAVPAGARAESLACGDADTVAGTYEKERMLDLTLARFGPAGFVTRPDETFSALFGRKRDLAPMGAIGNDVLRRHRVLVDYAGAQVFFEPVPGAVRPAFGPRVCVSLAYDDAGCPVVTRADATSGLLVGDVLVRVDEKDVCAMPSERVITTLAGEGEKRVEVRRQGAPMEVRAKGRAVLAR